MKKLNLMKVSAIASTALLLSTVSWAESEDITLSGDLDFLAITDFKVVTSSAYNGDDQEEWDGEGYHVGQQLCSFTVYNCKEINKSATVPEKSAFKFSILDADGETVDSGESDMSNIFKSIKYAKNISMLKQIQFGVMRGGRYKMVAEITPDLLSYANEVDVKDEACARVKNTSSKVGNGLCPEICLTSGYPYDAASISGEMTLDWSVSPDGQPDKVIASDTEILALTSEKPTLAAVDTLYLYVPDLEPGKYIYTMRSDFEGANRTFEASVIDTLRAELSIDKDKYTLGTDKEVKLKIDMNYGYPYIAADSETGTSTITIVTTLAGETASAEISDQSWASSTVNCTANIAVPLDKVTNELVEQNKDGVPLSLYIVFNSETQYQATIYLPIEAVSGGVNRIAADEKSEQELYYNVLGVPVDKSYRGVKISKAGSKIVK
jgi:hypothetical protein